MAGLLLDFWPEFTVALGERGWCSGYYTAFAPIAQITGGDAFVTVLESHAQQRQRFLYDQGKFLDCNDIVCQQIIRVKEPAEYRLDLCWTLKGAQSQGAPLECEPIYRKNASKEELQVVSMAPINGADGEPDARFEYEDASVRAPLMAAWARTLAAVQYGSNSEMKGFDLRKTDSGEMLTGTVDLAYFPTIGKRMNVSVYVIDEESRVIVGSSQMVAAQNRSCFDEPANCRMASNTEVQSFLELLFDTFFLNLEPQTCSGGQKAFSLFKGDGRRALLPPRFLGEHTFACGP